jgi:hypothetical protein
MQAISVAEATRRLRWQRSAGSLDPLASEVLGAHFGGIWIDKSTGRVQLGVAATATDGGNALSMTDVDRAVLRKASALLADAGLADCGDVVPVTYSWSELLATNSAISGALPAANAGAVRSISTGIRTDTNSVVLSVPAAPPLTAHQQAFIASVSSTYGNKVRVDAYEGTPHLR